MRASSHGKHGDEKEQIHVDHQHRCGPAAELAVENRLDELGLARPLLELCRQPQHGRQEAGEFPDRLGDGGKVLRAGEQLKGVHSPSARGEKSCFTTQSPVLSTRVAAACTRRDPRSEASLPAGHGNHGGHEPGDPCGEAQGPAEARVGGVVGEAPMQARKEGHIAPRARKLAAPVQGPVVVRGPDFDPACAPPCGPAAPGR